MENEVYQQLLKHEREKIGVTQERMAYLTGMLRQHYGRIETGAVSLTDEAREKIERAFRILDKDSMTAIIDYVRVRFSCMNAEYIMETVIGIKMKYVAETETALWGYSRRLYHGDIEVLTSDNPELGTLIELKGRGCRQLESLFNGQRRDWYGFFRDCLKNECVFKRVDVAINDYAGYLNIGELIEKCRNDECRSRFHGFRAYESGAMIKGHEETEVNEMGKTLYLGSFSSDLHFCIYEKKYEQLVHSGIQLSDTDIRNRFEIRAKNDRANVLVQSLVTYEYLYEAIFGIINHYMDVRDRNDKLHREDWDINRDWLIFIERYRDCDLKLTLAPEPFEWRRTMNWLSKQVAGSLKAALEIDKRNGTTHIKDMLNNHELPKHLETIIEQMTVSKEEILSR